MEGAAIIDNQSTGTWVNDGLCDDLGVEEGSPSMKGILCLRWRVMGLDMKEEQSEV